MDRYLRQELIEVAKRGETTYYEALRPEAPRSLTAPLTEIDSHEHMEGRPLLAAVVVHKDGEGPGTGFYESAWLLGVFLGGDAHAFWKGELVRVWEYWKSADS